MKIVIEINENEYTGIKSFPNANTSYPWTLHLYDAVRNGIPLDKVIEDIKAEIQTLRNCSCSCSDGIIDDVEDIIDKHTSGKGNE